MLNAQRESTASSAEHVEVAFNDCLSKGALTATQLFTTVISSLCTYQSLGKGKRQYVALLATASRVVDLELKPAAGRGWHPGSRRRCDNAWARSADVKSGVDGVTGRL